MVRMMPSRPTKKGKIKPLENKIKRKTKISNEARVFKCNISHAEGHKKLSYSKTTNKFVSFLAAYEVTNFFISMPIMLFII